jgi:hypothetical protein
VEVEPPRDCCALLRRLQDSTEQARHEFRIHSIGSADRLTRSRLGADLAELRSASHW